MIKKYKNTIFIFIVIFFLTTAIWNYLKHQNLEKNGIYTIATIVNVEAARGGLKTSIIYKLNNQVYKNIYIEDVNEVSYNDIGKKVLIKILRENPDEDFIIFLDKSLPDSINIIPANGWSISPF